MLTMQKVLLSISAILLVSCKSFPEVSVATLVEDQGAPVCVVAPSDGSEAVVLPIQSCYNYICHSPDDYRRIIEWGTKRISQSR